MKTVCIASGAFYSSVCRMFEARGWTITKGYDADLYVFTGGSDINPKLYGEAPIPGTYCSSQHDAEDLDLYKHIPKDAPKVGICRGAQLGNVLNGGKLWQNVDKHTTSHNLFDVKSGKSIRVTSLHHQMMRPSDKAEVLAVAKESTFREAEKDLESRDVLDYEDIEAVWYPETKFLCYQPHPEIDNKPGQDYFFSLIARTLNL